MGEFFAYASTASVTLNKNATVDAKSATVGYSFDAIATLIMMHLQKQQWIWLCFWLWKYPYLD